MSNMRWIKCTTKQSNSAHRLLHYILVKLSVGFLLIVYTIKTGSQFFSQCMFFFFLFIFIPVIVCFFYYFIFSEFFLYHFFFFVLYHKSIIYIISFISNI